MKWTEIPAGDLSAATRRLWDALGHEADAVAARLNRDPKYLANLAQFAIASGYESTPSQKRAREIMGANFFGIEEAIKHFMVHPTRSELAFLAEVPFPDTLLESCKDTHILVAVFPPSIIELRDQLEGRIQFYEPGWYENLAFANRKGEIGWELVRKVSVPGSTNKDWDEEQALLADSDEETPSAQVMVFTIAGHFLKTKERLFDHLYVHCRDISSLHYRVGVAFFAAAININSWPEDRRNETIGLAAAKRKRSKP